MTSVAHTLLALLIPELVLGIFEHLRPLEYYQRRHAAYRHLESAGLVCKAWYEGATTQIWRRAGLEALLSVLAPLRANQHGQYDAFERCPTAQDWRRFEPIADRVRVLSVRSTPTVSDALIGAMQVGRLNTSTSIFRNLHSVHFISPDILSPPRVLLLLPRSLKRLLVFPSSAGVSNEAYLAEALFFLELLPSRCPNISEVLLLSLEEAQIIKAAEETLLRLPGLQPITLGGLPSPWTFAISALSRLEVLRSLTLEFQWGMIQAGPSNQIPWGKEYPSLQEFHLKDLTLRQPDRLASTRIVIQSIPNQQRLRHLPLKDIRVDTVVKGDLLPLSACFTLKSLTLTISAPVVTTTEDEVMSVLQHMTQLEKLVVALEDQKRQTRLSLRTLEHALRYCPKLQSVVIIADTRSAVAERPEAAPSPHQYLETVAFHRASIRFQTISSIDAPQDLAETLASFSDKHLHIPVPGGM
ncbi:hypothetical protein FRB95_001665 [Tulasnella sp. JGI-2019a]|nr:hypothetical protein FRB95_001665 [Tulasnella sp. JGI-2019a]